MRPRHALTSPRCERGEPGRVTHPLDWRGGGVPVGTRVAPPSLTSPDGRGTAAACCPRPMRDGGWQPPATHTRASGQRGSPSGRAPATPRDLLSPRESPGAHRRAHRAHASAGWGPVTRQRVLHAPSPRQHAARRVAPSARPVPRAHPHSQRAALLRPAGDPWAGALRVGVSNRVGRVCPGLTCSPSGFRRQASPWTCTARRAVNGRDVW